MVRRGKLIVIDGTDGSGKATQTKLLINRMKFEHGPVETIAFPQYGKKSAGPVEEYLSGAYGSAKTVGPYRASLLYAVDRFDASFQIRDWLESGKHVVADRYVSANMGHQGSHIEDPAERGKFFTWDREIEHELLQTPKPDINIILHVPAAIAMELTKQRGGWKAKIARDILETDVKHIEAAEKTYLEMAERFPNDFRVVECVENGQLLSIESIHERVWGLVLPILSV